jgi:hypothetical protein
VNTPKKPDNYPVTEVPVSSSAAWLKTSLEKFLRILVDT